MYLLHTSVINLIQALSPQNIILSTLDEVKNIFSPHITSKDLSNEVLSIIKSVENWWSMDFFVDSGEKMRVTRWDFDGEMEMVFCG